MAQWVKALGMQGGCPEFNSWSPVKVKERTDRINLCFPSVYYGTRLCLHM